MNEKLKGSLIYFGEDSVYVDLETPIVAYCKKHGRFEILPKKLHTLNADNICPECKKLNERIAKNECNFNDFVEICKMKFPDNKVIYDGGEMYNVRVKLKCEIHGEFTVNTKHYYNCYGMCPECLKNEIKERFKHQSDIDAEIYKTVME